MKLKKYLNKSELKKLGFYKIGKNNQISKSLATFNFRGVIGDNNRIDENVILKGNVKLKNNIHLAKGCTLSGSKKGIYIDDFVSLSNYVQVFAISDDYRGACLGGGTLTEKQRLKYSKIIESKIEIGKCCTIGPFSVILPKTKIEDFVSISPHSTIYGKFQKGYFYKLNSNKKYKRNYKDIIKLYNKFFRNKL